MTTIGFISQVQYWKEVLLLKEKQETKETFTFAHLDGWTYGTVPGLQSPLLHRNGLLVYLPTGQKCKIRKEVGVHKKPLARQPMTRL